MRCEVLSEQVWVESYHIYISLQEMTDILTFYFDKCDSRIRVSKDELWDAIKENYLWFEDIPLSEYDLCRDQIPLHSEQDIVTWFKDPDDALFVTAFDLFSREKNLSNSRQMVLSYDKVVLHVEQEDQ